ncbi:hypothetical protein RHOFW510R12_01530 [Rhodanobacter sp. FW510-R12]|uniref:hypothetical protein n=1 Tax=unclassified Rhodanobacter TaxID=2621553 RepID=UPI0007A9DC5D|nr:MULTISPECIES: hypothetical protein [unclassified Rhodanobacter]KZC17014.1 hypothetical protein RHOFW104R8_13310 [Rhodanobacter sp. FW104-R8]KZC28538.1 hypothetical protein RhoFW510T8_10550 [Rhodanobacter sp. FW510-T8]KZC32359.1 hypothetical protein RhoFW510R10_13075 [Rhodanobacter sp. FW510-R10]
MAIATSTAIGLALAAAAAGGQYYNTTKTAERQDNQAALGIRNQSRIQKEADAKVNDAVARLADSNAASAKQSRLDDYMNVLRRNRSTVENGLTPNIGSDTFKTDAATAANDASSYADKTAGLMARMDAPGIQRQQEGFDYGNLATDIGLIGRESQGQNFLDQLKLGRIRRNAKIDLASGLMSAAAGGVASGGTSAASGAGNAYGNTLSAGGGLTYNMPSY